MYMAIIEWHFLVHVQQCFDNVHCLMHVLLVLWVNIDASVACFILVMQLCVCVCLASNIIMVMDS